MGRFRADISPPSAKDVSISRRHAEVTLHGDGDGALVRDVGSTFGTYVGDRAIETSGNQSQEDRYETWISIEHY